ncbi:MAG: DUF5667 domain-containing protein [Anaerolineales bacterium]
MFELKQSRSKILDDCLERIRTGQATIDDCLTKYPEHAEWLGSMVALAVEMRASLEPSYPQPGFVETSQKRLLSRLVLKPRRLAAHRRRGKRTWRLRPAHAYIALALVLCMLVIGTGFVQASAAALPGDALYNLKLGWERFQLALSWSAAGDLELLSQSTDTRLEEFQMLLQQGRDEDFERALEGFEGALTDLTEFAGNQDPETIQTSLEQIPGRLAHHQDVLIRVLEQVPPNAQGAIERAIESSSHSQEVIQQIRDGGNPSDSAPGQRRTPSGPPGADDDENSGHGPPDRTPGPPSDVTTGPPEPKPTNTPKN